MLTNSEIRALGRGTLKGRWGVSALHMLGYSIIVGIGSTVLNLIPFFGYLASIVLSGAIALGLYGYYLELARGEGQSFGTYFSGFNNFGRAFVLYLLMAIFTFLWTLLLIIPGIIAALRYSQAYFILRDNPEMSALEAIRQSKAMMDGYKWKLFLFHLSFIGWALLAILTFGIGMLWLYPYVLTSQAHFYDQLKRNGAFGQAPPPLDSPAFGG